MPNKTLVINVCLFLAALITAYIFFARQADCDLASAPATQGKPAQVNNAQALQSLVELNEQGERCVRDGGGVLVPIKVYGRIISLSISADAWLLAILGPERILAYCSYSKGKPYAAQLQGKLHFGDGKDVEGLLSAHGDLIIMPSAGGDYSVVNRLREAGLTVFNIGDMSGLDSFNHYARQIAYLCSAAVAGDALLANFNKKMTALAHDVKPADRKKALYVSVYEDQCYGGTAGTSYHDVLVAAGLDDVTDDVPWTWSSAWPQFSIEQLIQLNPELIVTQPGMAAQIKSIVGLGELAAVQANQVYEIDATLINDPGLLMYEAASMLHQAVYTAASE